MNKSIKISAILVWVILLITWGVFWIYQYQDKNEVACTILWGSYEKVEDNDIGFIINDPRECTTDKGRTMSVSWTCTSCIGSRFPSEKRKLYDSIFAERSFWDTLEFNPIQ